MTCTGWRASCAGRRACASRGRSPPGLRPAPGRRPPQVRGAGRSSCRDRRCAILTCRSLIGRRLTELCRSGLNLIRQTSWWRFRLAPRSKAPPTRVELDSAESAVTAGAVTPPAGLAYPISAESRWLLPGEAARSESNPFDVSPPARSSTCTSRSCTPSCAARSAKRWSSGCHGAHVSARWLRAGHDGTRARGTARRGLRSSGGGGPRCALPQSPARTPVLVSATARRTSPAFACSGSATWDWPPGAAQLGRSRGGSGPGPRIQAPRPGGLPGPGAAITTPKCVAKRGECDGGCSSPNYRACVDCIAQCGLAMISCLDACPKTP